MAITQVDIIRMNEYLQGQVESFYDIIPASTKMDLTELLETLIKMFRSGLKKCRKDLYLKNILIVIDSIIDELSDSEYGVDIDLADETKKLKSEYLEYAEIQGKRNEKIYELANKLSSYVYLEGAPGEIAKEELSEEERNAKLLEEATSSLKKADSEIEELRKEIERLKKEKSSLQKSVASKDRQLSAANQKASELSEKQREKNNKIDRLSKEAKNLNAKIVSQRQEIDRFSSIVKIYEVQQKELSHLRAEIVSNRKKERIFNKNNARDNSQYAIVKGIIIDAMMNSNVTYREIEQELIRRKIMLKRDVLFACIKEIEMEYNVDIGIKYKGEITYHISNPSLEIKKRISIPCPKNDYFDILLTGDWHLYSLNSKEFEILDALYEYCTIYNTNLIINMGDFTDYEFTGLNGELRGRLSQNAYNLIESIAKNLPYDKSINHYILGGNHDEQLRKVKIDCLKVLSDIRPDIFSLGYFHAFVELADITLALHHPMKRCDTLNRYKEYVNNYYKNNHLKKGDVFMDIFGHFHYYKYFLQENYLSVPSLIRDTKSAVHLRLFINSLGETEYIEIIPLKYQKSKGLERKDIIERPKELKR